MQRVRLIEINQLALIGSAAIARQLFQVISTGSGERNAEPRIVAAQQKFDHCQRRRGSGSQLYAFRIARGKRGAKLRSNLMKAKVKSDAGPAPGAVHRAGLQAGGSLADHPLIREAATSVRVRSRQRLAVSADGSETLYIARSGMMALTAQVDGRGRQLLSLLFPGEVFRTAYAPPLPDVALTGLAAGEAWRLSWAAFEAVCAKEPSLGHAYTRQAAAQSAGMGLHAAAIGALSGEERVATFLIELVLRLGRKTAAGIAFDMPMSREDIADYLALNADTLSRIMSRLRASGAISIAGRGHGLARDFRRLCEMSPMARAVSEMHGSGG